ncbi:MAG: hypothetical protein HQL42_20055 [Alphaproteobacteria bacterium]|nr:hypothetical protein [Alphaproteobacteria bacterium]
MSSKQPMPPDTAIVGIRKALESLPAPEAIRQFATADKAYKDGGGGGRVLSRLEGLSSDEQRQLRRRREMEAARETLRKSLLDRLLRGEVIGWGRKGTILDPWSIIPADFWTCHDLHWNNDAITVTGGGVRFYQVRFVEASAPGSASAVKEPAKKRGRPLDSGQYPEDEQLVKKMHLAIEARPSTTVHAAAVAVAPDAGGSGLFESKVWRLIRRYDRKYPSLDKNSKPD